MWYWPLAPTADVTQPELTIIIPDGDACLITVWIHYNSSLAARISKGDLELFISLHNKLFYHWNAELDPGLTSRDGHLSGESSSREINSSCEGNLMETADELNDYGHYALTEKYARLLRTYWYVKTHFNLFPLPCALSRSGIPARGKQVWRLRTSTPVNNGTCDSFTSHHC